MNINKYLEDNPNCEETYAIFRIIGDKLIPENITEELTIAPSFSHAKGESYISRSGKLKRQTGIWAITTEEKLNSTSIEYHLNYLLNKLEPLASKIIEIVNNSDFEVDFRCYWLSATGHGGPLLSRSLLQRISPLCNTLDFDFYGPYEDDE